MDPFPAPVFPAYPASLLMPIAIKDAEPFLPRFFQLADALDYPRERLSIGLLEGDSADETYLCCKRHLEQMRGRFRRGGLWKKDFGFRLRPGVNRHLPPLQLPRRSALAKARNHLLFNALEPEDAWVLWVDVDLIEYPPNILNIMLDTGKSIVQPDCTRSGDFHSYDRNAWRDQGRLHLDDLRTAGDLVRLDSVGGSMLLVRADVHRDGLIFPTFPYGVRNQRIRSPGQNFWNGEIETEGLGIMASDMGIECWGLPNVRTTHF